MGALIVQVPSILWASAALLCLVFVIWSVFTSLEISWLVRALLAVPGFVTFLLLGAGWVYNATHAVIPVNQTAVVVNTITQQLDGEMRPSGLINIPFWSSRVLYFPAQVSYNLTEDEVPAISGGTAITLKVVYMSDASKIDWKTQVLRQGKENDGEMFQVWRQKRSQAVSVAMGDVTLADLTSHLDQVGAKIYKQVYATFVAEGYPLGAVVIQFWDFQNKEAGQILDSKTAAAKADIEAAKLEQQAASIRADTANQVLQKQTQGLKAAMDTLGIVDTQTRGLIMQTYMLIQLLTSHANTMVVVSTGGSSGPTMLAPQTGATAPTPAPSTGAQ